MQLLRPAPSLFVRAESATREAGPRATSVIDPLQPLVVAALAGDADAQRTLLVTLAPALLRVIRGVLGGRRAEVEDTLQEAMIGVHGALAQFRGECSVTTFACRVAFHTAMNARRRAGYRTRWTPSVAPEQLGLTASEDVSPLQAAEANSCREQLALLLEELPAAQSEVLALHVILGYTIAETAQCTAVPVDTVRSRLRNALAKLRSRLLQTPVDAGRAAQRLGAK